MKLAKETVNESKDAYASEAADNDGYAYIPIYDVIISAGHGAWTEGAIRCWQGLSICYV